MIKIKKYLSFDRIKSHFFSLKNKWINRKNYYPDSVLDFLELRRLKKKYCRIPNTPSTGNRSVGLFAAFFVSVIIVFVVLGIRDISLEALVNWLKNEDKKVFFYFLTYIALAPILFAIWWFRDSNKLKEIEQQRKDTNLKEFQQLQEWAAGSFEGKDDNDALQISALHSLRGYLKGEYGDSFRRGAYETFCGVLKNEHTKIFEELESKKLLYSSENIHWVLETSDRTLIKQINRIASEDWFNLLVNHSFPTSGISLVGVDLSHAYLKEVDFSLSDLRGTFFLNANLRGCNFVHAQMQYSILNRADVRGASFFKAQLQKANFAFANTRKSEFSEAILDFAYMGFSQNMGGSFYSASMVSTIFETVRFQGADFRLADLRGANLIGADLQGIVVDETKLNGAKLDLANLSGVAPGIPVTGDFVNDIKARVNVSTSSSGFSYEEKNLDEKYVQHFWSRYVTNDEILEVSEKVKSLALEKNGSFTTGKLTEEVANNLIIEYKNYY